MDGIRDALRDYFRGFQELGRFQNTKTQKGIAALKVASYCTLIIPAALALVYAIATLHGRVSKTPRNARYKIITETFSEKLLRQSQGNPELQERVSKIEIKKDTFYTGAVGPDGNPCGMGKLTHPNGCTCEGIFEKDIGCAKGTYTYKDGVKYEGELQNNQPHGEGTLTYPSGNTYNSQFKDGKPHGVGLYTRKDGKTYKGEFKDGEQKGLFSLIPPANSKQDGPIAPASNPPGTKRLTFQNGDVYEGQVANKKPNGIGLYICKNGKRYQGEFKDGKPTKEITLIYPNNDTYKGEFIKGKASGQGILTYANGNKYEGEFKDGRPHGKGTLTYRKGKKYEGEFKDGKASGPGKLTLKNGTVQEGEFLNGKLRSDSIEPDSKSP